MVQLTPQEIEIMNQVSIKWAAALDVFQKQVKDINELMSKTKHYVKIKEEYNYNEVIVKNLHISFEVR